MSQRFLRIAFLFFFLASSALMSGYRAAAAAEEGWTVSLAEAKATAAKEKKDILMEFTGSDWCPPCIALHKNVLSTEEFKHEAPKHFVLLKLDSPRDKSKQTPAEIAQYKELSGQFEVSGVPTIILADADGRPYAKQVGYGGTAAQQYIAQLVEKIQVREQRDELFAKADAAAGADRAKLLDQALAVVGSDIPLGTYGDTIKEIVTADANNEAGLKAKYEGLENVARVKAELQKIIQGFSAGNPQDSLASLDKLIDELQPQGEALQEVLYLKGSILYRTDRAAAKEALLTAQKLAPSSKRGKEIERIITQVFKDDEPQKDEDK